MHDVDVGTRSLEHLAALIGESAWQDFRDGAEHARRRLRGRTVWCVSSTASGGGVSEMLHEVLAMTHGLGVDSRWVVIEGDAPFFATTKRLHNALHGADVPPPTDAERRHYEKVVAANAESWLPRVRRGDIVVVHDPQPAPLLAAARRVGATTIWRCHIGTDIADDATRRGWEFLRPYIEAADCVVFSRHAYAPEWARHHLALIAPAIDPLSAKNQDLEYDVARAVLASTGVLADAPPGVEPVLHRPDGQESRVRRTARIVREGGPLPGDTPLVVQVSRWDRLKDMAGVLAGFAEQVVGAAGDDGRSHLLLVGPDVSEITDDPEGRQVLAECTARWRDLDPSTRGRISLVSLPMVDLGENALMVNAAQRHAAVVTQKSLMEGFGLTVAEAMWKARPVVGSAVGGIADQIVDGETGVLVEPSDLVGFGAAVRRLLTDPAAAAQLGRAARDRVREHYLPHRQLADWAGVLTHAE